MVDIDDDLQGLLEDLDIGPEIDEPEPPVEKMPAVELPAIPEPLEPLGAQLPAPILETPVAPSDEPDTDLFKEEPGSQGGIDIGAFIAQHDRDYTEVKGNLRADRAKADEIVRMLLERITNGTASSQETESCVQAVKLLVDTNGHMVRLLDSKSKLLTASKGSVNTLIQQNFGGSDDLENILSQQLEDDDV